MLEDGFPQQPPKGYFMTKIFHPNVAQPAGDICVNTLKKDWNPAKWSLAHIFETVRCLLIVPFPESSLNEEAGKQFMEDYAGFCETARVFTEVHARPAPGQLPQTNENQEEEVKSAKLTPSSQDPRQGPVLGQVTNTSQAALPQEQASPFAPVPEQRMQEPVRKEPRKKDLGDKKRKYMNRL